MSDIALDNEMRAMTEGDPLQLDTQHGGGAGTIYKGIFMKRNEDLPEVIRALLGEHKTPQERFYRTVERLARNVSTYEMYEVLREIGLREGWAATSPGRRKGSGSRSREIPGIPSRASTSPRRWPRC